MIKNCYEPEYRWDENAGYAVCVLTDKKTHRVFFGTAVCSDEDEDMKSEKVGLALAEMRANLHFLEFVRDAELIPTLNVLYEYSNATKYTKDFGKRAKGILWHRINKYEAELKDVRDGIKDLKKNINNFIKEKDEFYQKVRKNREGKEE